MKKQLRKNDEAVSPVVGVMLMLVVTIIIAAVISGFAGGLVGSQEKAPQATIGIITGYGPSGDPTFDISFEHKGGDPIPTRDIEIITYLTLPNGTVVMHKQTGNSLGMPASTNTSAFQDAPAGVNYARMPFIRDQMRGNAYLKPADIDSGETKPLWFGQYTLMPGQLARVYTVYSCAAFLGLVPEDKVYRADKDAYEAGAAELRKCIQNSCTVDIKWLHVPSGKYILDKQIILQG